MFGDAEKIREHFSEYLQALRESPKADGAERSYTHGEKEVLAEKDRRENGIPVNDNTMVELAQLCDYLKLDFNRYFEGYQLSGNSRFFTGNYWACDKIPSTSSPSGSAVHWQYFPTLLLLRER